jgi:hypothetical protein
LTEMFARMFAAPVKLTGTPTVQVAVVTPTGRAMASLHFH